MPHLTVLDALVPFATRMADDGLIHVRAWHTPSGVVAVVAELDWPIQVADRADGYSGPGVFNYPHYALPAALAACARAGYPDPRFFVRLPSPPGERFLRVTDPDDPQGWEPIEATALAALLGLVEWPGPAPGTYTSRAIESRRPISD